MHVVLLNTVSFFIPVLSMTMAKLIVYEGFELQENYKFHQAKFKDRKTL